MSNKVILRGGLSIKEFESYSVEIAGWIWGAAQGAFNEKQTLSQVITDAGIGMIPLVGDITAIRDLIAISVGLINDPEKREKTSEWVLLVIFIFALIPVMGGLIKGVGRIALRVTEDVAKDSSALSKLADEELAMLRHYTTGNEQFWFKHLDVRSYSADLTKQFGEFCDRMILVISEYGLRFSAIIPNSMVKRLTTLSDGFKNLKALSSKMIPKALLDLHAKLERMQNLIRAGGVPPINKAKSIAVQTGQKTVTYVEEARLIEKGLGKKIKHAGKYPQNVANTKNLELDKIYTYEKGFPELTLDSDIATVGKISFYRNIAAASGPIKNEMLRGETLFRAFGEKGITLGVSVEKSKAIGAYWGRGAIPSTAEEWRQKYAVVDIWNRNGWLSLVHISHDAKIPACTSTVSEQFSNMGQFLEGGGKQAFITTFFEKRIKDVADQLLVAGGGKQKITLVSGGHITVEVKPSHWKDVNGTIGYGQEIIPYAAMTERLGLTERHIKTIRQSAGGVSKEQRANEHRQTR